MWKNGDGPFVSVPLHSCSYVKQGDGNKRTVPLAPPCHTHSPVCFHYAVISADRELKPVEEHFLRIQAVRVLPDLPE